MEISNPVGEGIAVAVEGPEAVEAEVEVVRGKELRGGILAHHQDG